MPPPESKSCGCALRCRNRRIQAVPPLPARPRGPVRGRWSRPEATRRRRRSAAASLQHGESRMEAGLDRAEDRDGDAVADGGGNADQSCAAKDHGLGAVLAHGVEGGGGEHVMRCGRVCGDFAAGRGDGADRGEGPREAEARQKLLEHRRPQLASGDDRVAASVLRSLAAGRLGQPEHGANRQLAQRQRPGSPKQASSTPSTSPAWGA